MFLFDCIDRGNNYKQQQVEMFTICQKYWPQGHFHYKLEKTPTQGV